MGQPDVNAGHITRSIETLFAELGEGAPADVADARNRVDAGLVRSLGKLDAAAASRESAPPATFVRSPGETRMRVSFDLERVRSETPACARRIHLNNAGAALMPAPVYEAIVEHLSRERELGGYEAADEAQADVDRVYSDVARVIGAQARNVALVENASVAFTQAIASFDLQAGDRVVTSRVDYVSQQLTLLALKKRLGIEIDIAQEL